ncbi:hypothetical protein [Streptomyces sp. NBC_00448]|uniref:hypothetical protein n=1 Tax=Streptomyces sp. NBC_00448 TaxID=2903652 RepID=UPI002E1D9871
MRTSLPPAPNRRRPGTGRRRHTLRTRDQAYVPSALRQVGPRRRPAAERTAS